MLRIRLIKLTLISSSLVILTGVYTSISIRKEIGSFNRHFIEFSGQPIHVWNLPGGSFYIAGRISDTLLMGRRDQPTELFMLHPKKPNIIGSTRITGKFAPNEPGSIDVYGGRFYLTELNSFRVFWGSTGDYIAHEILAKPNFFSSSVPISKSTVIIKTFVGGKGESVLARESNYEPEISYAHQILQKQIDGIFCTDGMLNYNQEAKRLVYLYYYRNQFMVMDTMLNLLYRANTIDTTTHANIKVVEVKSRKVITLDSPPRITNACSTTAGKWLFVNSTIIARNELLQQFKESSVIDVYNLREGQYTFSFYIPDYNNIKMKSFRVFNDKLWVAYRNYLVCYDFKPRSNYN